MPVRIFYVDESHDDTKFCLSALSIRHDKWHEAFAAVRKKREELKASHGLFLRKEIHAHEFLGGRGHISQNPIGEWQRSRIFHTLLQLAASLPSVRIINVCLDKKGQTDVQMKAWDRLINRIERWMRASEEDEQRIRTQLVSRIRQVAKKEDVDEIERRLTAYHPRALVISDEGRETEITTAFRRMHVFNPIPSMYGDWGDGSSTRNIVTNRLLEDPVFKESDRSYFLQLADCVSYALLKREVDPTPRVKKYGIHEMFDECLPAVCHKKASSKDPLGIVRK